MLIIITVLPYDITHNYIVGYPVCAQECAVLRDKISPLQMHVTILSPFHQCRIMYPGVHLLPRTQSTSSLLSTELERFKKCYYEQTISDNGV